MPTKMSVIVCGVCLQLSRGWTFADTAPIVIYNNGLQTLTYLTDRSITYSTIAAVTIRMK